MIRKRHGRTTARQMTSVRVRGESVACCVGFETSFETESEGRALLGSTSVVVVGECVVLTLPAE